MDPAYFWSSGMWIFPVAMLVVMLVVVFLLFGRGGVGPSCAPWQRPPRGGPPQERPLDILKRRYARGEISRGEFEEMKQDMGES